MSTGEKVPEGSVQCPFCCEDIKAGAIKCKHCGSDLRVSVGPPAAAPPQALGPEAMAAVTRPPRRKTTKNLDHQVYYDQGGVSITGLVFTHRHTNREFLIRKIETVQIDEDLSHVGCMGLLGYPLFFFIAPMAVGALEHKKVDDAVIMFLVLLGLVIAVARVVVQLMNPRHKLTLQVAGEPVSLILKINKTEAAALRDALYQAITDGK